MIYFADVLLKNAEEPQEETGVVISTTRLLSGKTKIQASTATDKKFSFICHTDDQADIDNIISKIGTAGTLEIDETQYTNCYIDSFKKTWEGNGNYTYEISFVRDTT